jgi:hypothetical protein
MYQCQNLSEQNAPATECIGTKRTETKHQRWALPIGVPIFDITLSDQYKYMTDNIRLPITR